MSTMPSLPGGTARRWRTAGLTTGRTRDRVQGPFDALALVADDLARAEEVLPGLVEHEVAALPHVARYVIAGGGKRLRPAITALGARALGVTPDPELMCCGELLHLGSLLHDDVVDQGDERRGRAAAHVVHGNAVAVLAGDLCVARALLAASRVGGQAAAEGLARTVADMAAGEVLQLQRAGMMQADLPGYLEVIERKSATLIAWCAAAAALQTGDRAAADALAAYGRAVGIAYQITDDVLDYHEHTGKRRGADLRERKVTLPLLHAFERIPGLRDELAAGPPSDEAVAVLVSRVASSGALEAALADASVYVDRALAALEDLPDTAAREAMAALAVHLVERSS